MSNKVAALRRLLAEAKENPPTHSVFEKRTVKAHELVLDQTPKARCIREIFRIADTYNWQCEIEKAMDDVKVIIIHHMEDDRLSALLARLVHLKDCIECGASSPDCPPAN